MRLGTFDPPISECLPLTGGQQDQGQQCDPARDLAPAPTFLALSGPVLPISNSW